MRWILQIVFIVLAGVSSAATYYVSPAGSDSNDGLNTVHPFLTIGQAVIVAPSGSSIRLFPGTYAGTPNIDLTISKNLSIASLGTSANTIWELAGTPGSHRALALATGVQLSLSGITFQDGVESSYGGAIYAVGSNTLSVKGCTFEFDQVTNGSSTGGAIYLSSGTLSLANCTFDSDHAMYGAAIACYAGTLNATQCTFSDNGSYNYGGGVYAASGMNCTFDGCTFHHDSAVYGATAYIAGSNATFKSCAITQETVVSDLGGVVQVDGYSTGQFTNTSFTENVGGTVVLLPGGSLINCRFQGNCPNQSGSVISSYYANVLSAVPLTLVDDLFANNRGSQVLLNAGNELKMSMCTVTANTVTTAAVVNNTTATISGSILWDGLLEVSTAKNATTTLTQTDTSDTMNIDPEFVSVATGDFHLRPTSKLIGMGNSADAVTYPTDLDGNLRHALPTLGCYETPVKHPVADAVGADGFERVLWFDTNGQASLWKVSAAGVKVSESHFASPSGFTPVSLSVGPDNRTYIFLKSDTLSTVVIWTVATSGTLASAKTYTPTTTGWVFRSGTVSGNSSLHLMWDNAQGAALFWEISATGVTTTRTSGPFTG